MKSILTILVAIPLILTNPGAGYAAAKPAVTVTPGTVYPAAEPCTIAATEFTLTGTGFEPGETAQVEVGGLEYDAVVAGRKGKFTITYDVQSTPSGIYPVTVSGDEGTIATSTLKIGYSGCWSTRRGTLKVSGAGFAADDEITVWLDGVAATTTETNAHGRFYWSGDCPDGDHGIKVTGSGTRSLNLGTFTC